MEQLTPTRRTALGGVGTALVGLGAFQGASAAQEDGGGEYVVRQGDQCIPLTPLSGDVPVRGFYDWRYPDPANNPYAVNWGTSYSSQGTVDLQRPNTSILMLYDGPRETSLVVVHGMYVPPEQRDQMEDLDGGSATFDILGLPEDGEWAVLDDQYEGLRSFDRFDITNTSATIDWTWAGGRTDGVVFRGLTGEETVEITPRFNEAATLYGRYYDGEVERWEVVSGDRTNPERTALDLNEPITIEGGSCDSAGTGTPTAGPEPEGTPTGQTEG